MAAHWLAVDTCHSDRAEAITYAWQRIEQIEQRPCSRVEAEAAVIICPLDHGYTAAQPEPEPVDGPVEIPVVHAAKRGRNPQGGTGSIVSCTEATE